MLPLLKLEQAGGTSDYAECLFGQVNPIKSKMQNKLKAGTLGSVSAQEIAVNYASCCKPKSIVQVLLTTTTTAPTTIVIKLLGVAVSSSSILPPEEKG